jgi:hypothetical protein
MTDEITKIVFTAPPKNTPGFLRRIKRVFELSKNLQENPTVEDIEELIKFLLVYISSPVDKKEAEEALWDASEEQFMQMLEAMKGEMNKDVIPLPNGVK